MGAARDRIKKETRKKARQEEAAKIEAQPAEVKEVTIAGEELQEKKIEIFDKLEEIKTTTQSTGNVYSSSGMALDALFDLCEALEGFFEDISSMIIALDEKIGKVQNENAKRNKTSGKQAGQGDKAKSKATSEKDSKGKQRDSKEAPKNSEEENQKDTD